LKKIEEAKKILEAFELSKKQQNDRSARVLLALLGLKEKDPWRNASNKLIGIHDIIKFIANYYNFHYAENSRESIRRQSIHQFVQIGLVVKNIDDPSRPTNSGLTVYSITLEALEVIKVFNTPHWVKALSNFNLNSKSLIKKYEKIRKKYQVTVKIRDKEYILSSGKHNKLQKEILDFFAPQFAGNTTVIYIGDTAKKKIYHDQEYCEKINIDITQHDKLPDIILFDSGKNLVFFIEAVTSHGPISNKRIIEIKEMLGKSSVQTIFVSAFPDFRTFLKYASEIAWETEVWISENPEHMIHYNGEKFLGTIF